MENLQLVFPEIFLSLSLMFLLILGVFKKNSSKLIQNISLIILLITAVITFNETISINGEKLFNNSVIIDYLSSFMRGNVVIDFRNALNPENFINKNITLYQVGRGPFN